MLENDLFGSAYHFSNIGIPLGLYTFSSGSVTRRLLFLSYPLSAKKRTRTCVCLSCLSFLVTPINNDIIDKTIPVLGNERGSWEHQKPMSSYFDLLDFFFPYFFFSYIFFLFHSPFHPQLSMPRFVFLHLVVVELFVAFTLLCAHSYWMPTIVFYDFYLKLLGNTNILLHQLLRTPIRDRHHSADTRRASFSLKDLKE